MKLVQNRFAQIAAHEQVRYLGNVTVGRDVSLTELMTCYDIVVLAYGASSDRRLGVPGEDLKGVYSARDFVGWMNSDPSQRNAEFNLNCHRAVIIGNGNVAIDLARIFLRNAADLESTDIAPKAIQALRESKIREVR